MQLQAPELQKRPDTINAPGKLHRVKDSILTFYGAS